MNKIYWDKSGIPTRIAVVELCGWCNKRGTATPTGKRISTTKWDDLSSAAKNVLLRHGIKGN
jgi:hypothetical protein